MFTQELTVYALAALFVAGPLSRVSRVKAAAVGGLGSDHRQSDFRVH